MSAKIKFYELKSQKWRFCLFSCNIPTVGKTIPEIEEVRINEKYLSPSWQRFEDIPHIHRHIIRSIHNVTVSVFFG